MIVLGLTGSIGMGKSTTAGLFRDLGVPVFDADATVHTLYEPGGAAVRPIGEVFPAAVIAKRVDRGALKRIIAADPDALARLNSLVHPLVQALREQFLQAQAEAGETVVVLDIPLLFETGADRQCDAVAVVSAPAEVQRARVMLRPGMTVHHLERLLAQQTPDDEKRRRADFVIDTSRGVADARRQVEGILQALRKPDWRPSARRDPRST